MAFYQYFNGTYSSLDTPLFQSNDLGLLRGFGMFDYFRTYNGFPFRWDDYWARFERSALLLKLQIPYSKEEVASILAELYERSGESEVAFRFLLTGGYAPDSVHVVEPNFLIRTEKLPENNPLDREKGIKVLPYEYVRDLASVKSTNYVHMILMADAMKAAQASDLLFYKNGEVSELTRSNVFLICGNTLITPSEHILHGITRMTILELAAADFKVEVRPVRLEELYEADEVFTTSTTKWVLPIVQIGDRQIGQGTLGPKSKYLGEQFEKLIQNWGLK
jgi:branched-chain amino acid aminotransferase